MYYGNLWEALDMARLPATSRINYDWWAQHVRIPRAYLFLSKPVTPSRAVVTADRAPGH